MEVMKMENREMKGKVMKIGNRLAVTMGRSAALKKAWAIVRNGLDLEVRGTSFGNRQTALSRLEKYAPECVKAEFQPEPENAADRNAVAIMVSVNNSRLYKLGYVPRENALVIAAAMRVNSSLSLKVIGGGYWNYGARVKLAM
jgi:hypothetical protein